MFEVVAAVLIGIAFVSAVVIAVDEFRHPQKMAIMNAVWPVTALYFSVFGLWAYFAKGRNMTRAAEGTRQEKPHKNARSGQRRGPTLGQTALATSHCGAGCTLADIVTEFAVFGTGATLFGTELYASYVWDFAAAWLLGVVFQFFTIQPMRQLSVGDGIWAAVKADTLSILAFQVGMYGWMALVYFKLFSHPHLHPNEPGYWLMMQVAMICGFVTALPVNWLLVRTGLKEAMG